MGATTLAACGGEVKSSADSGTGNRGSSGSLGGSSGGLGGNSSGQGGSSAGSDGELLGIGGVAQGGSESTIIDSGPDPNMEDAGAPANIYGAAPAR